MAYIVPKRNIFRPLFDIRPTKFGDVDFELISRVKKVLDLRDLGGVSRGEDYKLLSEFEEPVVIKAISIPSEQTKVSLSDYFRAILLGICDLLRLGGKRAYVLVKYVFWWMPKYLLEYIFWYLPRYILWYIRRLTQTIHLSPRLFRLSPRSVKWAIVGVVIILIAMAISAIYLREGKELQAEIVSGASQISQEIETGFTAARAGDLNLAKVGLKNSLEIIAGIDKEIREYLGPFSHFAWILSAKKFGEAKFLLQDLKETLTISLKLIEESQELLKNDFVSLSLKEGGSFPEIFEKIKKIRQELRSLEVALKKLNSSSESLSERFPLFSEKYPLLRSLIQDFDIFLASLSQLLGQRNQKHYLLLFQNPSELRATGGFLGSYGVAAIKDGQLVDLEVRDIYDPDGQVKIKVAPPRPLWRLTTTWEARDANWFFDFKTSVQKIIGFLDESGLVPKIDGVIALNTKFMEGLLRITGPIDLPEYDAEITDYNFLEVVQYNVEAGPDKYELGQPKRILKVLAPKLLARLENLSEIEKTFLFEHIKRSLKRKDIMFYFQDEKVQKLVEKNGWGGRVLGVSSDTDYLAVVHSNIAGGKADAVTSQRLKLVAQIQEDGSVVNTLTITRTHQGEGANYDFWRATNKDYLRVYTPRGSQLLEILGYWKRKITPLVDYRDDEFLIDPDLAAIENSLVVEPESGTDIFEESQKTVFGNWLYIEAGESADFVIKYKLPFKINLLGSGPEYRFLYQKQSGCDNSLEVVVRLPEGFVFEQNNRSEFKFYRSETGAVERINLKIKNQI